MKYLYYCYHVHLYIAEEILLLLMLSIVVWNFATDHVQLWWTKYCILSPNECNMATAHVQLMKHFHSSCSALLDETLLFLMFSTCDEILLLWRAWLHPWTQPVHVGWCTAPRGVHHATCTVSNHRWAQSAMDWWIDTDSIDQYFWSHFHRCYRSIG